jgi:hypothetical protein
MQLRLIGTIALLILAASPIQQAKTDELQNDFQKLQGAWTLYYAEQDGSSFLPGGSVQLLVQGNRFLLAPNTPGAMMAWLSSSCVGFILAPRTKRGNYSARN